MTNNKAVWLPTSFINKYNVRKVRFFTSFKDLFNSITSSVNWLGVWNTNLDFSVTMSVIKVLKKKLSTHFENCLSLLLGSREVVTQTFGSRKPTYWYSSSNAWIFFEGSKSNSNSFINSRASERNSVGIGFSFKV